MPNPQQRPHISHMLNDEYQNAEHPLPQHPYQESRQEEFSQQSTPQLPSLQHQQRSFSVIPQIYPQQPQPQFHPMYQQQNMVQLQPLQVLPPHQFQPQPISGQQQAMYPYDQQQMLYRQAIPDERNLKRHLSSRNVKMRKKTMVACETCRLKKIRCSNEKPVCQSCINHGYNCVYRNETLKDTEQSSQNSSRKSISNTGSAKESDSLSINNKLDLILKEILSLKQQPAADLQYITPGSTDVVDTEKLSRILLQCKWFTAPEYILQWPTFLEHYKSPPIVTSLTNKQNSPAVFEIDFNEFTDPKKLEKFSKRVIHNLLYFVNSFVNNTHTKAPVIDLAKLYATVERICEAKSFDCINEEDLQTYYPASIPILVASLGMLSAPLDLPEGQPKPQFANSLELLAHLERHKKSSKIFHFGCFKELQERTHYLIYDDFYQLDSCVIEFLKKTMYMYLLKPIEAWKCLQRASSSLVMYLKTHNFPSEELVDGNGNDMAEDISIDDKKLVERLYWIIYKEESELRVELSPHISPTPSEILNYLPPASFPVPVLFDSTQIHFKEPSSSADDSNDEDSDKELIDTNDGTVVKKQNDSIWYFFLNETALRKLENKFLEDIYSEDPNKSWGRMFVDPVNLNTMLFKIGGYMNEIDVIVDKLHPNIKEMLLKSDEEVLQNIETKNYPINKNFSPTANENNKKIPIFKLFEALVFIKTRIVAMKMLLGRPIFYYFSLLESREEIMSFVSNPVLAQFLKESFSLANIANPELLRHRHNGTWYVLRNLYVGCLYILAVIPKLLKFPEAVELLQTDDFKVPSKETMTIFTKQMVSVLEYWCEEAPELKISIDIITRIATDNGLL